MLIRCALIDDSEFDIAKIKTVLEQAAYGTDIMIHCDAFHSSEEFRLKTPYDLYVLDIDMPFVNGFQLAEEIYEQNSDATVVFCTNHDEFVFDSYRMNAFYFVRKSNLKEDMQSALKKFISKKQNADACCIVQNGMDVQKVPLKDIAYVRVLHNDLILHLSDSSEIRKKRETMKSFAEEARGKGFAQINQSIMINLRYVRKIFNHTIWLTSGEKFEISRSMLKQTVTAFAMYSMR